MNKKLKISLLIAIIYWLPASISLLNIIIGDGNIFPEYLDALLYPAYFPGFILGFFLGDLWGYIGQILTLILLTIIIRVIYYVFESVLIKRNEKASNH